MVRNFWGSARRSSFRWPGCALFPLRLSSATPCDSVPIFLFSFLAVRSLVLPPPQGFHHHPLVHDSHIWVSSAGGSPEFSSCYPPHPALSYLTHLRWTHFSPHDAHTCFSSKLPHRSNGTAIHPVTQARILGIFLDSPLSRQSLHSVDSTFYMYLKSAQHFSSPHCQSLGHHLPVQLQ